MKFLRVYSYLVIPESESKPLTTIRVQQYRVGVEAAEYLVGAIHPDAAAAPPPHARLPVALIVRGSTAPPRS